MTLMGPQLAQEKEGRDMWRIVVRWMQTVEHKWKEMRVLSLQ
jgi:hypothetical protein